MGANLITYICVGPDQLSLSTARRLETLQAAEARLQELRQQWIKAIELPPGREPATEDFAVALEDAGEPPEAAPYLSGERPVAEALDQLLAVWNDPPRDANKRRHPDDSHLCIYVAGDTSWGDVPDGLAYRTLGVANALGLFDLLGIR